MDTKDWISTVCTMISTTVTVITLIITIADKRKTAPRKPSKRKRKR